MGFTVKQTVSISRIMDMLVNASDTGVTAYWCSSETYSRFCGGHAEQRAKSWAELVARLPKDERKELTGSWLEGIGREFFPQYILPLVPGEYWTIKDDEGKAHRLDRAAIERGIAVMADKHLNYFADMLTDKDDADTADVFVQCCLFGEVLYS